MPNRRDFLSTLGLALGATTLGRPRALAAMTSASMHLPRHLPRIGIQLYTVRSLTEKDLEGTLAKLATIGYAEVEFAGYFGKTPEQIRAMLIAHRLSSPSSHIPLPANDDAWQRALADARTIGHEWAVIPWLDPSQRTEWPRFADRLNHLATMARASGMRFAYHNHDFEFTKEGNGTVMDLLLKNTDPSLVDFEMDIYWVTKAGANPLDLIARHPNRFPLMHAKDASAGERAIVDVGKGTINFARIFAQERTSGMTHVYVENDNPTDAIQSATTSYRYLSNLKY